MKRNQNINIFIKHEIDKNNYFIIPFFKKKLNIFQ